MADEAAAAAPRNPAAPGDPQVIQVGNEVPDVSIHESGASADTTRTAFDPKYTEQIGNQAAAVDSQIQDTADQGVINIQKAQGAETGAGDALKESDRYLLERKSGIDAADAEVKAKMDASAARRRDLEAASKNRITSYWEDKGKPAELFSIFITGLSEASNIRAGGKYGDSPLQHYFDKALEDDQKKKLAKFEDSKLFQELSDKDVEAARRAKIDKLTEIKDEHSVMIDNLIKKAEAYAAKLGTQEAHVKANEEIAKLQERKAKDLGDIYKELSTKTVGHSGSTDTVTNIKTKPGEKTAGAADVKEHEQLKLTETTNAKVETLLAKNPDALGEVQDAEKFWAQNEHMNDVNALGVPIGKLSQVISEHVRDIPTTRDGFLKNASPEAKQLNDMIQQVAQSYAKEGGGTVSEGDRDWAKASMGLMGKNAQEAAVAARERRLKATQTRKSLEANVKFKDVPQSETEKQASKATALSNLVKVTSVKGVGKAAIIEMAERAKAAGVDASLVDDLVKKARR